jgi:hypothetical protein
MDTLDGDPISSSFGHLSINQKYPREYSYSSGGGKGGGGYFTIPYGFKATPLSSYDFTIEQRDKIYLKEKRLNHSILGRGITWFDMGTYENVFECAEFVRLIDKRQGFKISDI